MASDQEYIRYGSNSIRGYLGDELHFELSSDGFSTFKADVDNATFTVTGYTAGAKSWTYHIWRLGRLRVLEVAPIAVEAVNAAHITTTAIPAADRPATSTYAIIAGQDAAAKAPLLVWLKTDGTLDVSIAAGGGNFAAAVGGPDGPFTITYAVASPLAP